MRKWPRVLKPPCGPAVRRAVAVFSLCVGVPRLPWPGFTPLYNPLRFADPWVYGAIMTALGVALYYTSYHSRLSVPGRVVAALAFSAWTVLAAATSSTTSMWINLAVASMLLAEIWSQRGGCDDES